jgi:hypothetical protein
LRGFPPNDVGDENSAQDQGAPKDFFFSVDKKFNKEALARVQVDVGSI